MYVDCRCMVMWSNIICNAGRSLSVWGPSWSEELQEDNWGQ